jgi:hypothetical protein
VELKPKGPDRKTGLHEFEQCKEVQGGKMTVKVYRTPFEEKANKVIKENLSPKLKKELEMKYGKELLANLLSFHEHPERKLQLHQLKDQLAALSMEEISRYVLTNNFQIESQKLGNIR